MPRCDWPNRPFACYTDVAGAIQPARKPGCGVAGIPSMEKALKHKFVVGETVYFTASNVARPAASGTYEVIRLLPTDGDDCQYRIKNSTEAFERVAKESQLAVS
jgi:arginine/ornithine N-succinyltransferase beta subunit